MALSQGGSLRPIRLLAKTGSEVLRRPHECVAVRQRGRT